MTVPDTVTAFRVAGLTLLPGDEIPAEFEALTPEDWRTQTTAAAPKPTAKETK